MTRIDELNRTISKLYDRSDIQDVAFSDAAFSIDSQAYFLAMFAREYISAASALEKQGPTFILPICQLTGHAVECALKACLAADNVHPPNNHDLVDLCKSVDSRGFAIDDRTVNMIIHLNHIYYRDLVTGTKFKSRYPTKANERLAGIVAANSIFVPIIRNLLEQAQQRSGPLWQEMFDSLKLHFPAVSDD